MIFRYAVVGLLLTDEPLDISGNEVAIDGACPIGDALTSAPRAALAGPTGDATDVLLGLEDWPAP